MKSKFKKKLAYLVILSILVLSVSIVFLFSDSFSGDIVELSIITPSDFSCKAWSAFTDNDISGGVRAYSPVTVNFPSFTKLDVLSVSGKTMNFVDTTTNVECKSLNSNTVDIYLVGGTVRTSFFTTNELGQFVFLKQVDRNVSTVPRLVLDNKQILPSGLIYGSEINSKITSSKEYFDTKLRVQVSVELKFSQAGKLFNTNAGGGLMTASIPIKLYNPVKIPTPSTSNVVDLKRLSQTVFDLKDYSTRSLLVTAIGELPQWKSSEGSPFVKLIDPSGKVVGSFGMSSNRLISSSTNTYEFSTTNLIIPKSPLGIWKIEMHSNGDIRRVSSTLPSIDTMIVQTYDSSVKTTPPPPISTAQCIKLSNNLQEICLSDDEFKLGGVCYQKTLQWCVDYHNEIISKGHDIPQSELVASVFIAYKLTFNQGGTDVGQVPQDNSIKVDFTPLNFIASPKGVDEKLETVTLIQSIDTTMLKANISNLEVNTKLNVLIDGTIAKENVSLTTSQLKKLSTYSTTRDYYLMNQIVLNSFDIKQILSDVNLSDGSLITLQSVTDGTFDVSTSSGTKKGAFSGLTFTYDLRYSQEDTTVDPCKGLSGEELLSCRGGDPNNCVDMVDVVGDENCRYKEGSTGGTCQGLTPTECAQQGKGNLIPTDNPLCDAFGIGCNPTGKGSNVIECPNGSFASKDSTGKQICIDNTTRNPVDPLNILPDVSFLTFETYVIIFIVFVFVILIILLLKRKK